MKIVSTKTVKKSVLAFAMILTTLASPKLFAEGGDNGPGNGGELLAIPFAILGDNIVTEMETLGEAKFKGIDIEKLRKAVMDTQVIALDKQPVDQKGRPKDAVNYPEKNEIHFFNEAWIKNLENPTPLVHLVLHEYLSISGQERSDQYTNTAIIMSRLSKEKVSYDSLIPRDYPNPFDYSGRWECVSENEREYRFVIRGCRAIKWGVETDVDCWKWVDGLKYELTLTKEILNARSVYRLATEKFIEESSQIYYDGHYDRDAEFEAVELRSFFSLNGTTESQKRLLSAYYYSASCNLMQTVDLAQYQNGYINVQLLNRDKLRIQRSKLNFKNNGTGDTKKDFYWDYNVTIDNCTRI